MPAGWYPDPDPRHYGTRRYWDGSAWTDHQIPMSAWAVKAAGKRQPDTSALSTRPQRRSVWGVVLTVLAGPAILAVVIFLVFTNHVDRSTGSRSDSPSEHAATGAPEVIYLVTGTAEAAAVTFSTPTGT